MNEYLSPKEVEELISIDWFDSLNKYDHIEIMVILKDLLDNNVITLETAISVLTSFENKQLKV